MITNNYTIKKNKLFSNFEADLGLHSYTLKINQFVDMVNVNLKEKIRIIFPIRLIPASVGQSILIREVFYRTEIDF